jgi:hypothetical protein
MINILKLLKNRYISFRTKKLTDRLDRVVFYILLLRDYSEQIEYLKNRYFIANGAQDYKKLNKQFIVTHNMQSKLIKEFKKYCILNFISQEYIFNITLNVLSFLYSEDVQAYVNYM